MIGENSAIRKYRNKLAPALSKSYGGNGPYTKAQVDTAARELRLNHKYIHYAYLMFCEQEVLAQEDVQPDMISKMHDSVAAAIGGGIVAAPIDMLFGGDGDGSGIGDGGGGGDA